MAITFVAAGTAASADGAAPTPGLPAGLAADDAMIAVFYSRESTDGTVSISTAGWQQIVNDLSTGGLLGIWSRAFQSGDAAPTFVVGNMAAGDDCIAQLAGFRGARPAQPVSNIGAIVTSAAAANIGVITAFTALAGETVVCIGGKEDDWTSVAALTTGADTLVWTEIGETVSIAGADAGLVWDYVINGAASVAVSSQSFVVTGGTAQTSKGVMIAIAPKETRVRPPMRRALRRFIRR